MFRTVRVIERPPGASVATSHALSYDDLDPTVLRAPFGIVGAIRLRVVGNRLRLAPAARGDARAVHLRIRDEPLLDARGALFGQRLVVGVGALAIGVSFD